MDEHDDEAARLLGTLRGFRPPPGSPDVGRAVRSGRRRVRVRRAAATAAAALAVVAAQLTVPLLGQEATAPPGERFDAGRHAFDVGSAGGFTPVSYEAGRDVQRILLRPERPGGSLRADGIVEMYPKGGLPAGSGGRPPSGRPAPAVHGHRAYVLAAPVVRPGAVELAWEWKPGAWGYVSLKGPGADDTRAQRVALSVLPAGTSTRPRPTASSPPAATTPPPATPTPSAGEGAAPAAERTEGQARP